MALFCLPLPFPASREIPSHALHCSTSCNISNQLGPLGLSENRSYIASWPVDRPQGAAFWPFVSRPFSVQSGSLRNAQTSSAADSSGERAEELQKESANTTLEAGPTVDEAKIVAGYNNNIQTVALNKGKGAAMADFLMVFGGLLDRPFGSGQTIAAAGAAVVERVKAEAEALQPGGVNQQAIFELLRVVRLLEMDLQLVHAARKKETLLERLEVAKMRCRQAVLIANSLD